MKKFKAFTMAELLVTIAVLGIVAIIIFPTFFNGYKEKSWNTAANRFAKDLGEALQIMNADEALAGYYSTMDFVKALKGYFKIVKICDSSHLKECFSEEFIWGEEIVKVNDLKDSSKLNKDGNYDTETVGVQLASGYVALIAYNKYTTQDAFNNSVVEIVPIGGNEDSLTVSTDAVSVLFDINAFSEPNTYGSADIRGINISFGDFVKEPEVSGFGEAVSCAQMSYYLPCLGSTIQATSEDGIITNFDGIDPSAVSPDGTRMNFETAVNYCKSQGLRLPSPSEANSLYNSGKYSFQSGNYWATTNPNINSCGSSDGIYTGSCENCNMGSGGCGRKESSALNYVRCVK